MSQSIPDLKHTNSFYNKIGFVSFYIKTLIYNNKAKNAVSYATTFLEAYRKEIFDTRWHLFFTAYLQALLTAEKYEKVTGLTKRYNLIGLEKKFIDSTVYLPVLQWYHEVALFIEGRQSKENLIETIVNSAVGLLSHSYKAGRVFELLDVIHDFVPEETAEIKNRLTKLAF